LKNSTSLNTEKPLVHAIVVGTNDNRWLEACFETLLASDYPNLEVVYVDNASTDGSSDVVEAMFPGVMVIRCPSNKGFAGANNIALERALCQHAKYVFLVNPDTRTPASLISKLVDFMETYNAYGITGPLQYIYASDCRPDAFNAWSKEALKNGERHVFHHREPWRASEAGPIEGRAEGTLEHAYVQGAAFFIRCTVLEKVGIFDETFHTFYEEVDLCRRARWAGYRVALLLTLGIEHWGGGGILTGGSRYRNYHYSRNRYYYVFTEPTYSVLQGLRLASRWLWHDIKEALRKDGGNVSDVPQLLQILWWLVRHIHHIRNQRLWRLALFHKRSAPASFSLLTQGASSLSTTPEANADISTRPEVR
jgi:GT2 family glycosyltransferase